MTATPFSRLLPAACLLLALAAPALAQPALHSLDDHDHVAVTLADGTVVIRCGTPEPTAAERAASDAVVARFLAEGGTQRRYVVPVAMHIVAQTGGAGVVPMTQVVAQIRAMNEGYRGSPFSFYLARVDTTLNTSWHNSGSGSAAESAMLTALAVDPSRTLNVFLRNPGAGLLGYAYGPGTGGVFWSSHNLYSSVPGGTAAPYNLGFTVVHEVGHNLGLPHTFSGGCSPGDGIADTPAEAGQTFGCPHTQDSCPTSPGRDPIHNFMDYTDDACMFEFTPGQAVRMAAQIATFKPDLGESGQPADVQSDDLLALDRGAVVRESLSTEVRIRNLGTDPLTGAEVAYEVRQGAAVVTSGTVPWAGTLAHDETASVPLPALALAPGAYSLHVASTLPGGTLDAQPQNDTLSATFAVVGPATALASTFDTDAERYPWLRRNSTGYVQNWAYRANTTGAAGTPTTVAFARHFDFRIPGVRYDLTAPPVTVPPVGRLELAFDLAYAPRTNREQPFAILVSTDGGATFATAREFTDAETATRPAQNAAYTPTAADHWRRFTVALTPFAPRDGQPPADLRLRFASTDNDGNNRYLDNVTLTVGDAVLVLEGEEGWRMLSGPTSGVTFDDLLGSIWTQGFPGSDAPASTPPSVLGYTEATPGPRAAGFAPPTSQTAAMGDGRGYLVYVYADDDNDGTPEGFPKTLTASGGAPAGPVALPVTYTPTTPTALPFDDGWNLLGNPYPDAVDWDLLTRTGVTRTVYAWDGEVQEFRLWNGSVGTLAGGLIPAGQGFYVRAVAAGPTLAVPEAARVPNPGAPPAPGPALAFSLATTTAPAHTTRAFLTYEASAVPGFDDEDALFLTPLSEDYVAFYSVPAGGPATAIDARPEPVGTEVASYELQTRFLDGGVAAARELTLSWDGLAALPTDLVFTLLDRETNTTVDLRMQSTYTFTTSATAPTTARFLLTVNRVGVATEGGPGAAFALLPAAPNPFRGSAALAYTLDAPARVRLAVYDALGRLVATLAEGERAPGRHAAVLDGAALRAGVYLVRLEADGVNGRRVATARVVHAD